MLNIDVVNEEIEDLESRDTCYAVCEKLAWLYIVREQLEKKMPVKHSDTSISFTKVMNDTEFLECARKLDKEKLLSFFNMIMNDMKVVMPAQYNSIMTKLRVAVK